MKYINIKTKAYGVETVDEFKTLKEAKRMLKKYQLSDLCNTYYLSQKCDKTWIY